jgi:hypothetical protein
MLGDMSGKITVSEGIPKGDKGVVKQFWVSPEHVVFAFHISDFDCSICSSKTLWDSVLLF